MGKRNRRKVRAGHGHQRPPRQPTRPGVPTRVTRPDDSDTPHRHDPVSRIEGTFAAALRQFDGNRGALAKGEIDALAHWWSVGATSPEERVSRAGPRANPLPPVRPDRVHVGTRLAASRCSPRDPPP